MINEVIVNGVYEDENGNKIISSVGLKNINVKFYGKNNFLIINDKAEDIGQLYNTTA